MRRKKYFAGKMIYGVIGVINLILISVIFSFLTSCFKSIWAACGLHSFWNAILYSVLGLNLSECSYNYCIGFWGCAGFCYGKKGKEK